jgi:hypothetical protein
MLPTIALPATFTLKCQGNQSPCITRTQGSCCFGGTEGANQQAWLPHAGSTIVLCSWKPMWIIRPQNFCCPQAWFPHAGNRALYCTPRSLCCQSDPRTPTSGRFGSPVPAELPWLLVGPVLPLPKGLVLLCLRGYCTALLETTPGKDIPKLPLPKHLVSLLPSWSPGLESKLQNSCRPKTWFPCACSSCHAHASRQDPRLPLPPGLGPPCLQQLPWPLEAYATTQVDLGSPLPCEQQMIQALWLCCPTGTINLLLSANSLPPYMQVNPSLHTLLFYWCQEASLPIEHGGPSLSTKSSCRRAPAAPPKDRNPPPPPSGNLSLCGCQEICFPNAQNGPVLPTVPNYGRAPHFSIKE